MTGNRMSTAIQSSPFTGHPPPASLATAISMAMHCSAPTPTHPRIRTQLQSTVVH